MAEPLVTVGVQADPADLARIAANTQAAFGKGAEAGSKEAAAAIKKTLTPAFEAMNREAAKVGSGGAAAGLDKLGTAARGAGKALSVTAEDTLQIANRLKALSDTLTGLTAAIQRETSTMQRSSIEANSEATRASNAQLIQLRNAGKLTAIEAQSAGQVQVREARTSGQQRVQITRSVLETIGRLEKGLGTTLAGIARTSVGAVSKAFDGLTAVFRRGDRETFSSSTFTSSLRERESALRTSFSRQESLVRESVSRQERQLTELRTQASTGILGAANRSGLLGGLAVGFAALSAVKSTFTVGADFTRGLAVLQASLNLTADDMKKVRQESIDLGNDISLPGVSALDAAQAIQTLTKQFGALGPAAVTAAEAAAKGTLQLARASGASADDAAALIGSAVNVFKVNASDAVGAADKITGALTRAAGVGFTDFKDAFVQGATVFENFVGPAQSANDTLLDFNTTLAILAKNGITGSNAGAGLKQFFIQAAQGTKGAIKATAEVTARAKETGTIFFDASGKARKFADSVEILRKGVAGLTDKARTDLLGHLFGSRSVTIANALINSTGESFAHLRDQIAVQGLAAQIAAAQNTGLKGALDALQSVAETLQIVLFEKVNKPLGAAVLAVTNFANTVLFSATPAMHTLRIALLGVTAGIGGLLALKTAAEVITLVGKAAALAFTPFGALVVLFGTVGAAVALFNDKSKFLGDAFTKVKGGVQTLGDAIATRAQPVIESVTNFIQGTAIPTAVRWAGIVARDLKGAFEATVGFVRDTVIPGFQRFVGVLTTEVFPRIASVAETVSTAVVRAKDAVVGFARDVASVVGPLIAPAIDGFQRLGKSLGDLVSGNFSTIGSGLASAGKGIGSAFANIGVAILPSLKTLGSTIFNFFKDVFSSDNLIKAVGGVGAFLNFIGEQLGKIVSNPKVLAAVGIVAGVAAKLAFDLVSGVVEGIASNIPRLLADAWQLAVKFAFKPDVILTAIIGGLALLTGSRLLASFRSLGDGAGAGFVAGFKAKVSSGGGFLSGLLQGPENIQNSTAFKALDDFNRQVQDTQNKLRAFGSTTIIDSQNLQSIKDAEKELGGLKQHLTDAQQAGLIFRDKLSVGFKAIGGVLKGGGEIATGIAQIPLAFGKAGLEAARSLGASLRTGIQNLGALIFGNPAEIASQGEKTGTTFGAKLRDGLKGAAGTIKAGFATITDALQAAAQQSGLTAGQALAKGLKAGAIAAVAIGGGIAAGQALGASKGGADTAVNLAQLAATSLAVASISVPAAIATAGIGLLTAAFSDDGEAARIAKQNVADFSAVLKGDLKDGTLAATKGIIDLGGAINDANLSSILGTKLLEAKSGLVDLSDALTAAGISFGDVQAAFKSGGEAVDALGARLINSKVGFLAGSNAGKQLKDIYGQLKTSIDHVNDATKFLASGQKDISTGALSIIHNIKGASATIATATTSVQAFGQAVLDANTTGGSAGSGQLLVDRFKSINDSISNLQQKVNKGIIPGGTVSNVQPALDVETALTNIKQLKEDIDAQFAAGILPPGVTALQDTLNQAILAVQGGGGAIQKAFENVGKAASEGGISLDVRAAIDSNQLKLLGDNISKTIQQGVADGVVITADDARKVVQPIKDEFERGVTDPVVIAQIEAAFNNIILTLTPTIDAANAASAAQSAVNAAQGAVGSQVIDLPVVFDNPVVDPTFAAAAQAAAADASVSIPTTFATPSSDVTGSQFAKDLLDVAGVPSAGIAIPTTVTPPTVPRNFADPAIAAGGSAGLATGSGIDRGIIVGIANGSAAVQAAATAMAQKAVAAANRALKISSPSVVFQRIGGFIIAGLVKGIADGGTDVVASITDLVGRAVDAATGAINDASRALRSGSSDLFSALFGSESAPSKSGFGGIQGNITLAFNSLAGAIDDSFNRAADVLKRSATEALSRAELDVLGERGNSLDPRDVLGAANRGALVDTIDQILGLGKSLIDQGAPAAQVTATIRQYLDQTRALAVQYGLNINDVNAVIDSLGLGGTALDNFVAATARMAEVLGTARTDAQALNDQIVELFKGVTDGSPFKSITGVGAAEDARAAVTAALSGVAAAADANDQRAREIFDNINKGIALSFADQLAFNQGLNGRQINTSDQFGLANRAAFESVIDDIKKLGGALLAGGSSAQFVTDTINQQIQALINYGVSLGFNAMQIQDLVNKAGLGADSLAKFNQTVADAATVADTARNTIGQNNALVPPAPGSLPDPNNQFTTDPVAPPVVRDVIVNQYLPYADPAAIALAAQNGVASAVRLPV